MSKSLKEKPSDYLFFGIQKKKVEEERDCRSVWQKKWLGKGISWCLMGMCFLQI